MSLLELPSGPQSETLNRPNREEEDERKQWLTQNGRDAAINPLPPQPEQVGLNLNLKVVKA